MGDILGGTGAPQQGYEFQYMIGDTIVKAAPGYVHTVCISAVVQAGAPLPYLVALLDGATPVMQWESSAAAMATGDMNHCAVLDILCEDSIVIAVVIGPANVCVTYV